jgi:hypothetical protein
VREVASWGARPIRAAGRDGSVCELLPNTSTLTRQEICHAQIPAVTLTYRTADLASERGVRALFRRIERAAR